MINKEEGDIDDNEMTIKMKKEKDTNITTMKLKLFANIFSVFLLLLNKTIFNFDKEVLWQKDNDTHSLQLCHRSIILVIRYVGE